MDINKKIDQADNHRKKIDSILTPVNKKIVKLLDQDGACIFYRGGDGWELLFEIDDFPYSAPVALIDFDILFKMGREKAIEYLAKYAQ